ncbi:MAG: nucleoside hydrolase, partial [Clostridia bacterium]|nr:nucleoside hydrolase [Clostridia bacterium]
MKKKKQNIIIDCDPGVDDAIALLYALQSENLNVQLIATEAGNNHVKSITENAIHLTELFKSDVPVVQGVENPIKRQASYALKAQGKGGLGGYNFNRKKLKKSPLQESASDAMYNVLKANKEKTTIVSIGPMTNIAVLLNEHPDAKDYIKEIIFESGTKEKIYGKPYKSFNVGFDPEAAEIVFKSEIPLVMVPMELGHIAYLDKDDIKLFKKTNKIGKIFAKMFTKYHDHHVGDMGAAVHD